MACLTSWKASKRSYPRSLTPLPLPLGERSEGRVQVAADKMRGDLRCRRIAVPHGLVRQQDVLRLAVEIIWTRLPQGRTGLLHPGQEPS